MDIYISTEPFTVTDEVDDLTGISMKVVRDSTDLVIKRLLPEEFAEQYTLRE